MGSYMIWNITFKDKESKEEFEKAMKKKCIKAKDIHDHNIEEEKHYGNFYYDMGYLGYAEAEEMESELKKIGIGVIELKQICLCDIEGDSVFINKANLRGKE